jgi:hypothetical protein
LFLELGGFDTSFTLPTFEDMELGCRLAARSLLSRHMSDAQVVHAARYDLLGLARVYFHKSRDLTSLLLSRRSLSFADQGWTHRKNWVVLASAWATLCLGPLAIWVHPVWVMPWALAALTFLVGSADLYRTMARRRWIYGPLVLLAFLGINCVATAGMLMAALDWLTGLRGRPVLAQSTGDPVSSKKGKERSLGSVENS